MSDFMKSTTWIYVSIRYKIELSENPIQILIMNEGVTL